MGSDIGLSKIHASHLVKFQSTLPHGERPTTISGDIITQEFQSTLPHGERQLQSLLQMSRQQSFNPRSHMGSDFGNPHKTKISISFNPRSHMGSDQRVFSAGTFTTVSIHAPTWGATWLWNDQVYQADVSIHAPTWGATHNRISRYVPPSAVSIHAPTWGATLTRLQDYWTSRFQSTLPHGERLYVPPPA